MKKLRSLGNFIFYNFPVKAWSIVVLTALFYGVLINNINLWSDEIYSVLMAKDSFADMWVLLTTEDSKPPLYYLYLKGVIALFPSKYEIFGAHFASYILLIVAQIFTIIEVRKDYGDKVSFWMLWVLALHPVSFWLAFEARTYMLSSLLIYCALIWGMRLTRNPSSKDYVKFFIASLLGLYSHYYVAIWLMFLYALLLAIIIRDNNFAKLGKKFLGLSLGVAILFSPWLYIPLTTAKDISQYWYVNKEFVKFSFRFFIDPLQPEIWQSVYFIATVFSASSFSLVVVLGCFNFEKYSSKIKRLFLVAVLSFALSYLLLYLLSYWVRPMITSRYVNTFSLIWYVCGALVIANTEMLKKALFTILLVGGIFTYKDIKAVSFDHHYQNAVNDIRNFIPKDVTLLAFDNANLFCEYFLPEYKCALAVGEHGEILRKPTLLKNIDVYKQEPMVSNFIISYYNKVSEECNKYPSQYRQGPDFKICKISYESAKKYLDDSLNLRLNKYL
ncbi:MAG: glycosyltransferase family 39 protein [Alphaproteobacteria bacterium]|nr:glycosyltransferase family 39 protein [Alphaproteobacteria bacterium]